MAIDAVAAIDALGSAAGIRRPVPAETPQANFVDWLERQVGQVDEQIKAADHSVQSLAVGDTEDLHRVILDVEQARLSLDLVVQIRNRLVEAYQEVLRLQL